MQARRILLLWSFFHFACTVYAKIMLKYGKSTWIYGVMAKTLSLTTNRDQVEIFQNSLIECMEKAAFQTSDLSL